MTRKSKIRIVVSILYKLFISVVFLAGLVFFGFNVYLHNRPCISSGSDYDIQKALTHWGSVAKLCQNSTFLLEKPIVFTEPYQQIYTERYPTDSRRALLKNVNDKYSIAIDAYNTNGIKIKNIIVDGNRRELGHYASHGLIIAGGNVEGQEISGIYAFDSRSWTTIHVNWGNFYTDEDKNRRTKCHNVKVINNTIGPSGEAIEGRWSDGISVQCEDSKIINNTITDVTDAGIAIFGAPGTHVLHNKIYAINAPLIIGISLVDYHDYLGNFNGVNVEDNLIESKDSYVRVGVAMGSRAWECVDGEFDILNRGGTIKNNLLVGKNFGYGYVVNGVSDWIVENNRSQATHNGIPGEPCGGRNAKPAPFLIQRENSSGSFQEEFRQGKLDRVHEVKPLL